jgi:predicted metal-dependent hydrolase
MHPLLRFTLDLFESNQPVAQLDSGQSAIKNRANKTPRSKSGVGALGSQDKPTPRQPTVPMPGQEKAMSGSVPEVPMPVSTPDAPVSALTTSFRHPRASRELRLGDAVVAYEFKRGQRRSIGFSVGPDGLAVRAPKWVPLAEVDAALKSKAPWILRKLQETRERHARLAAHVIEWRDGASLPFLGQTVTILLDPEHRFGSAGAELVQASGLERGGAAATFPSVGAATTAGAGAAPSVHVGAASSQFSTVARIFPGNEPSVLRVSLPHTASPEQIRDMVQAWLMRQARQIFQQRLDHFAPLLGVQWKKLALSNAGTRWGSARIDGSIRLNWRLVHFRMSVLDYVVAHELSHLRVMDHSPRFWETVRTVVPDYAALRQQLKSEAAPRWD